MCHHLTIPKINASRPKMNRNKMIFFIWRAFALEEFLISDAEHQIKPMSVTRTKGKNQKETKLKTNGRGDRLTAKMKRAAAAKAAFFVPFIFPEEHSSL
jgi:hypothetical protein